MRQRIAVGVDAGGTSTVAALARGATFERCICGEGANANSRGISAAAAVIVDAVRIVCAGELPDAVVVGAAGAGRSSIAGRIADALRAEFPALRALHVGDDACIALRAAIPAGDGIVLVAGKGSVAYAEHGERRARVGGAGYLLGDEGSAFAIGFAAVRLLGRTFDGRARPDETTELVKRTLGCADRDGLLEAIYETPRLDVARIAALAPSIIAFAGKGNRASTKIVQAAAAELADLIKAAAVRVELVDAAPPVALAGGLFRENSLLSLLVETRLTGDIPGAHAVRQRSLNGDEAARAALTIAQGLESRAVP